MKILIWIAAIIAAISIIVSLILYISAIRQANNAPVDASSTDTTTP